MASASLRVGGGVNLVLRILKHKGMKETKIQRVKSDRNDYKLGDLSVLGDSKKLYWIAI